MNSGGAEPEPASGRQQWVNEHFDSEALYWQAIYEDPSLQGVVYRERQRTVLALIDEAGAPPHAKVLEIGCGAGLLTRELALRGYEVDALDASPAMVQLTSARMERERHGAVVRTQVADVHALPFADGAFDLIVAVGVLPWLHELDRALRELTRVLRPGGSAVLTADNRARLNVLVDPRASLVLAPLKRLRRAVGAGSGSPGGATSRLYFPSHIDTALRSCGLRVIARRSAGFGPFSVWGRPLLGDERGIALHRRLQVLADDGVPLLRRGGWHYVVRAQRP